MNSEDYAVVVGISRYPGLGKAPSASADLQAAETDAEGVCQWLIQPEGGGLPKDNVALVLTGHFPPSDDVQDVQPQGERIREEFKRLETLAQKSEAAGNGRRVGRRLYIYMSGHGFSPRRSQGALYTANATPIDPLNSFASGWLEWFQDNGYFREYVLWLDCCMDREFTVTPEPVFRPRGVFRQAGPTFIGFAAHRPLKAVERPIAEDSGTFHGIFTWTLLRGLRGAAVDQETGEITGRSLGDYLINAMKSSLSPEDLANPEISKEPEIPQADPRLIFARDVIGLQQLVTFRFAPECENETATIWSGNPPQPSSIPISGGAAPKSLPVGLHVIEVPAVGIRQGFEVVGGQTMEVVVSERSVPVAASAGMTFTLSVSPADPTAEIFVVDHRLALRNQGKRVLATGLDFGLYKVKVRVGRESHESIFLLDRDVTLDSSALESVLKDQSLNLLLPRPQLASAAPLNGTTMIHEYHVAAGASLAQEHLIRPPQLFGDVEGPSLAEIRIMARVWTGPSGGSPGARPWDAVEITDSNGRILLELSDLPMQNPARDPFVTARVEVVPGPYFLRRRLRDGRQLEQCLMVSMGWAVEVFMLAVAESGAEEASAPEASKQLSLNQCTVLMRRLTQPLSIDAREDGVLEFARIALVDERHVLNDELENLLFHVFESPLAGIIGAHLLIMDAAQGGPNSGERLRLLDGIVSNLRSLVGLDHPDVEAISLCCPSKELHAARPFQAPPMFERSWKLIVKATEGRSDLIPGSLWGRVHAAVKYGGYFVWARDSTTQQAHLRRLKEWAKMTAYGETEIREAQAASPRASSHEAVFVPAASAVSAGALESTLPPDISGLAREVGIPTGALDSLLQ